MTKKDFEVIAEIIKGIEHYDNRRTAAYRFARELNIRFPKFKPYVFLKACNALGEQDT